MKTVEFTKNFRKIQVRFSKFYARVLNHENISISQYALLNELALSGPLPMSEVGEKLNVTKPAVTHIVDRLEARKFLRRSFHPTDRRIFLIKIMPKGKKVVRKIQNRVLKIVSKTLNQFNSKEERVIIRYQNSIASILDQVLTKNVKSKT